MYETDHTHFKGLMNTKCIQQHHRNCMHVMDFNPYPEDLCKYYTGDWDAFLSGSITFSRCLFTFGLKTLSDIKPDTSVHKNKTESCVLSLMDGAQGCAITSTSAHAKNIHRRGGAKPTAKHLHILKFSQCAERFNRQKLAVGKWHGWAWLERLPATLIRHTTHPSEQKIYRTSKATFWWRIWWRRFMPKEAQCKVNSKEKKDSRSRKWSKSEKRNYVIKKKDNKY